MAKRKKKKGKVNAHRVLVEAGYDSPPFDFNLIQTEGVRLARQGLNREEILVEIVRKYGRPQNASKREDRPAAAVPVKYFGEPSVDFDQKVYEQMENAARLPVAARAAVMPDGHPGYALPIGGVIGLDNAVSPSFVGYDIACRMMLSVMDITPQKFMQRRQQLANDMRAVSHFGVGGGFSGANRRQHPVMDEALWQSIPVLRSHKTRAQDQLGTSGGGNHFFDALIGSVVAEADWMPLPIGAEFVAIMTHSGSRGVGNKLAQHYQKLAAVETRARYDGIPRGYEWFSMDSEAGQEYWEVMQLMGRYARANHQLIHNLFFERLGGQVRQLARWENHHNFAFEESNMIIHRKGATPAQKGRVGIIPGSSGTLSFLVEGLGNEESLNSSSHGAGRPFSRTQAKKYHDPRSFRNHMKHHDILSYGVAADETYMAYKNIEHVMSLQEGVLVRRIARLRPVVVIMGGGKADDGD
jgi:tRNA-splicing ligase RtcB (3'-phosphate/5'-hydroxy nucleic acid ligase)